MLELNFSPFPEIKTVLSFRRRRNLLHLTTDTYIDVSFVDMTRVYLNLFYNKKLLHA